MWTLLYDWPNPPLNANQRLGHWAYAKRKALIRDVTYKLAREAQIPRLGHCSVILRWTVPDKRRRDVDNPTPTYKHACDGLIDRWHNGILIPGIVRDDIPELMTKTMPEIVLVPGERKLELIIEGEAS